MINEKKIIKNYVFKDLKIRIHGYPSWKYIDIIIVSEKCEINFIVNVCNHNYEFIDYCKASYVIGENLKDMINELKKEKKEINKIIKNFKYQLSVFNGL